MRILVTGAAGFIGSTLCRALEADHELLALDALTYAAGFRRRGLVVGDICDESLMARLLANFSPDAVIHLAAETHVDRSIESAAPFVRTNVVGMHALLSAALTYWRALPGRRRQTFRFVHVSTDEVFGALGPEDPPFTERSRYDPRSPYSASKASGDHLARAFHHTHGLPVVIAHPSNNYGPWQFPEKLIPLATLNALEEMPVGVYGDGRQVRDWLHVEDHAAALALLAVHGRPGESYVVSARCERANIDVASTLMDLVDEKAPPARGRRALLSLVADRPGHDFRYAGDPSKIEAETGWRPRIAFERGLADTVSWYLDNRDWWTPLRERVYAGQRLGLAKSA